MRLPGGAETAHERPQKETRATPAQRAQHLKPYQLADDRMADIHKLAELRGSPHVGQCRHRMMFVYAANAAFYVGDRRQLITEVNGFAQRHFKDAKHYTAKRIRTLLDRFDQDKAGAVAIWNGLRTDMRYKMTNAYIIDLLQMSDDEKKQMKTIIGPAEKQRRREDRRRQAGMVCYAERTAERISRATELRQQGFSLKAIGWHFEISAPAACNLLKRSGIN